jgi:hypothetical protein
MLGVDGQVQLSASDLVGHLNCRYLTRLDFAVASGELHKPSIWDPVLDILAERGALHERSYVEHLKAEGFEVESIEGASIEPSAVRRTLEAMQAGWQVISQGVLKIGQWTGRPDILRRVERPSELGAWSGS